mmetsp:Transcript_14781/g.14381  ORF Transcript_14781/g.14381 Transcript_14781/m.14381 type:complete len:87 (+) Transcript_14781:1373-1633(+)
MQELILNGLTGISALGLSDIISTSKGTLRVFEGGLMDQDSMNGSFCVPLSFAFELEELDLTGTKNVGDEGIGALLKGDIKVEGGMS